MTLSNPFALIMVFMLVLYVSVFLHEVGHVLMGRATGFVIGSFGMGTARPWCVIPIAGMRVYFAHVRPFQGLTFSWVPQLLPSKRRLTLFLAGGLMANGSLAIFALLLTYLMPTVWLWPLVATVNGFLLLGNAVPFPVRVGSSVLRSDSALILHVLRAGSLDVSPPLIIRNVRFFRDFWLQIGDILSLRTNLLMATAAQIQLGNSEEAEALCTEAEALPTPAPPIQQAFNALIRGDLAQMTEQFDKAADAFGVAETEFRRENHQVGQILLSISLAALRYDRGDAQGASADLETLSTHRLVAEYPVLAVSITQLRILIVAAVSDDQAVASLLALYEQLRRVCPSTIFDHKVYATVAEFHARREEWTLAEPCYVHASNALGELSMAWADEEERLRFLANHSAFVAAARRCAEHLGRAEVMAQLDENLQMTDAEILSERNQKLRRWGLRILLVNVVYLLCCVVWAFLVSGSDTQQILRVLRPVGFFAMLTVVDVLYLAFDMTIGRLLPGLRNAGGAVILIFACVPWFSIAEFVVTLLTRGFPLMKA